MADDTNQVGQQSCVVYCHFGLSCKANKCGDAVKSFPSAQPNFIAYGGQDAHGTRDGSWCLAFKTAILLVSA